jgi:uncharacterized membrane protein
VVEWFFVAMMVVATWFGAYGALYLKKGAQELKGSLIKKITNRKVWFGLLLYGIASAISLIPMKFADAHIIYPMTSMSYIWVAILSKKKLKEDLNKYKIMGIILIILGMFLLAK